MEPHSRHRGAATGAWLEYSAIWPERPFCFFAGSASTARGRSADRHFRPNPQKTRNGHPGGEGTSAGALTASAAGLRLPASCACRRASRRADGPFPLGPGQPIVVHRDREDAFLRQPSCFTRSGDLRVPPYPFGTRRILLIWSSEIREAGLRDHRPDPGLLLLRSARARPARHRPVRRKPVAATVRQSCRIAPGVGRRVGSAPR